MKINTASTICVFFCAGVTLGNAAGTPDSENWPQWRGPTGTGTQPAGDLPRKWSNRQNMRWKVPIPGRGHATPIIWRNRVFILTAIPADKKDADDARKKTTRSRGLRARISKPTSTHKFDLLCLDRKTGKLLWQQTAREEKPHEGHYRRRGTFASGSPVTDGKHLYAYFGSRGLYCYDMDGHLKWERDLGKMYMRHAFGEGSSPTLYNDTIVINMDQERNSYIIALDKHTGKTLWKKRRDESSSWSTPVVVVHDGKPQIILPATSAIRCYDLQTGDLIWHCGWTSGNVIPTPVFGHGLVFLTTGHRRYSLKAIRLGATGDLTDSDVIAWSLKRGTPYVPSPLLYGDELYLLRDKGFLSCYDAKTGKPHYELKRLRGNFSASPVAAGNHIYMVSEDGDVLVVKRGPEFEILETIPMGETFFASPAIVGNDLFLRSDEHLYCIGKTDAKASQ